MPRVQCVVNNLYHNDVAIRFQITESSFDVLEDCPKWVRLQAGFSFLVVTVLLNQLHDHTYPGGPCMIQYGQIN